MDSNKMETETLDYQDVVRKFRIENNILIGHELPINRKPINMSEVLLNVLKSKPNCVGQIDAVTGKAHTFADMTERSIKCALWLKKQGVKPNDVVGLCTDNHLDAIIIMLGTMYIGAISNTGDYKLSLITAQYFLSQTSPTIMFVVSSSAASVTEAVKKLKLNTKIVVLEETNGYESLEDVLKGHGSNEIAEFQCAPVSKPDEIALLVSSSGTTGMPKITEISHFSLYTCLLPEKITEMKDHVCIWLPTLRWHYGVQLAFQAIMAYSTRIVASDCNDDVVAYCEFIEKYKITFFSSDPCILIRLVKTDLLEKYRLSTLKIIEVSGAPFGKEYHKALAEKLPHSLILNGYGLTDTGGDVSVQVKGCKPGSIGFVAPNVRIKIIDIETEKLLGANQTGELRVKLPCVMNGYYKNPEATKRAFDSDSKYLQCFIGKMNWLRTGDLGYYDEDGEVYIIDRISEFINSASINVSPAEIEYVLGTHPAVLHAVVIGIPHEIDEQHPMAVVTLVPGKTVTEQELIDLVEKNMPDHCKLRAGVKILDQLPRTATGKIAKKKLLEMFVH